MTNVGDGDPLILVGCSGYSYADWKEVFYPRGTSQGEMLAHYARQFPFVELNTTFYRLPSPFMLAAMERKTPPGFKFFVKAYTRFTHERDAAAADYAAFMQALEPLRAAGKLAGVLAQFPNGFKPGDANRDYLRRLRERFPGVELAVEFRHRAWVADENTFRLLQEEGLAFVGVDEPAYGTLVPPIVRATAPIGYVRLHGRNREKWWRHERAEERYDYLYSEAELKEWAGRLADLARQTRVTYVAMNNHPRGQATINARMLQEMLFGR